MTPCRRHVFDVVGLSPAVPGAEVRRCRNCGHKRLRPVALDVACCGFCLAGRHDACGLGACCSVLVSMTRGTQ